MFSSYRWRWFYFPLIVLFLFLLVVLKRAKEPTAQATPPPTPPTPPTPPQWTLDRQSFNDFYALYSAYNGRLGVDVTVLPDELPHQQINDLSVSANDLYDFMNLDRVNFTRCLDALELISTYRAASDTYVCQFVVDHRDEAIYIHCYKPISMWYDGGAPPALSSDLAIIGFNRTTANVYYFEYFHNN